MPSFRRLGLLAAMAFAVATGSRAQSPVPPAPPTPVAGSPATVDDNGYVRLEVTLSVSGDGKHLTFNNCPSGSIWSVDIDALLKGSKHSTLGVTITVPNMSPVTLNPVAIDISKSGLFGLSKSCTISVDQIDYLSPLIFVRGASQGFDVSSTFGTTNAANPGLMDTVDAAVNAASVLAAVPVATAAPYQNLVKGILGQVQITNKEVYTQHLKIAVGPLPPPVTFTAKGVLQGPDGAPPADLILTAALVPVASVIHNPPPAADGSPGPWTASDVLNSAFATNLDPALSASGKLGGFVAAYDTTNVPALKSATTLAQEDGACSSLKARIDMLGLSDRDESLLIWALVHDRAVPTGASAYDVDQMACLKAAWSYLPASIKMADKPKDATPVPDGSKDDVPGKVAPTVKQMKATTQIDDAFADFFVVPAWADRKSSAQTLFYWPVNYVDSGAFLMRSSATVQNADQWLAFLYNNINGPVASKVGCYAYFDGASLPPAAADAQSRSTMFAIAETAAGSPAGAGHQVLLVVRFANVTASGAVKISEIDVQDTMTPEQRKAMLGAMAGSVCSSGYHPTLLFGP